MPHCLGGTYRWRSGCSGRLVRDVCLGDHPAPQGCFQQPDGGGHPQHACGAELLPSPVKSRCALGVASAHLPVRAFYSSRRQPQLSTPVTGLGRRPAWNWERRGLRPAASRPNPCCGPSPPDAGALAWEPFPHVFMCFQVMQALIKRCLLRHVLF